MGPEMVILHHAAPMGVNHPFACFLWSDAVFPVIFVSKATPRPTEYGNPNLLKRFHNIVTDSIRIRDRRILTHPYALINTTTQMLGEMSINIAVNRSFAGIGVQHTS
ncbi:hypothetical protein D3C74_326680 [compost metagenome]